MNKISVLEQRILDRELNMISMKLGKIGQDLIDTFSKYDDVLGRHQDSFAKYLAEQVISAHEPYFAGYKTRLAIKSDTSSIPEELKAVILKWAVDDFIAQADHVADIIHDL